jgi:hypothetical protein
MRKNTRNDERIKGIISVEEQIKVIPLGIVPCFALIRPMSKKGNNDVRKRRNSFCIDPGKVDPSPILSIVYKQTFPLDPGSEHCEGVGWHL